MKKKYKIPFFRTGSGVAQLLEWTNLSEGEVREEPRWPCVPTEWRENSEFFGELILHGHCRGRSSVRFKVMNASNKEIYSMGMAAFYDAVNEFGCRNKTICGKWTFRKQGANYGLVPVLEK